VVVKPAVSVGAIGAHRVARGGMGAWTARHATEAPPGGDRLVQPLMAEVADGETSMIAVEGRITHAVRKVPAPGDFRVQIEHGGREIACTPSAADLELADRALAAVGRSLLYARIDCVTTPDGPRLMELELIEPTLFLSLAPGPALDALGVAVANRLA
jgi:glutathione synthase/RimK-type ligase-like ATP-grasp enzyme